MAGEAPQVAATVMRDQMIVAKELVGADVVERAIARLAPDVRQDIEGMLPGGFLSIWSARAYHQAVADELERDVDEWHKEIVRAGTLRTFSTVWRAFLRFTSLPSIVKRAETVYRKTYDTGTMEADAPGWNRAGARVSGWPGMPYFEAQALAAGMEAVLHLSGRRTATVSYVMEPDGATFVMHLEA